MNIRSMICVLAVTLVSITPALAAQGQGGGQGQSADSRTTSEGSFKLVSKRVRDIQRQLRNSGYEPGDIDGIFGPQTSRAIIQYQKKHGLPQTGFPDTEFLDHLYQRPEAKPR